MATKDFQAGDVIQYENGCLDYLIAIPGEEGVWVNACNPSWIDLGRRTFAQECYPFFDTGLEEVKVVGHYGSGTAKDARMWYEENEAIYRGKQR